MMLHFMQAWEIIWESLLLFSLEIGPVSFVVDKSSVWVSKEIYKPQSRTGQCPYRSRIPLLQQMAFTFTDAELVRVYYSYKMTLNNNNWFSNLQIKLTATVLKNELT